jgi:hypothetical protein
MMRSSECGVGRRRVRAVLYNGFTLAAWLVVIGIMGVLLALLLPAIDMGPLALAGRIREGAMVLTATAQVTLFSRQMICSRVAGALEFAEFVSTTAPHRRTITPMPCFGGGGRLAVAG